MEDDEWDTKVKRWGNYIPVRFKNDFYSGFLCYGIGFSVDPQINECH